MMLKLIDASNLCDMKGDEDTSQHLPDQPRSLRHPPLLLHHPRHPGRLTHKLLEGWRGNGEMIYLCQLA